MFKVDPRTELLDGVLISCEKRTRLSRYQIGASGVRRDSPVTINRRATVNEGTRIHE